jgi:magnesium transporter
MVDCAVYLGGARLSSPASLGEMFQALRLLEPAMGWIGLYRPSNDELAALAAEFDLHELAVEDAIVAHQWPKLERSRSS